MINIIVVIILCEELNHHFNQLTERLNGSLVNNAKSVIAHERGVHLTF